MEWQTAVTAETTVPLWDTYRRPYTQAERDLSPRLLCFCKSVQVLHTVQQVAALLQQFGWECLECLPYGPNLAPSDFYLWAFWRSILVVTDSEVMQESRKLSHSGSACKTQNSVLKATFTDNMLWQMPEPSGWLCGRVGHCSVLSWEMLFWIKICWVSKYSVYILTFWSTLINVYISRSYSEHLLYVWCR